MDGTATLLSCEEYSNILSDAMVELDVIVQLAFEILSVRTFSRHRRWLRCRESAGIIINNEHLLPAEQPFAWLGAQRPSEAVAGLLVKLGAQVVQPALGRLRTLQVRLDMHCQPPEFPKSKQVLYTAFERISRCTRVILLLAMVYECESSALLGSRRRRWGSRNV